MSEAIGIDTVLEETEIQELLMGLEVAILSLKRETVWRSGSNEKVTKRLRKARRLLKSIIDDSPGVPEVSKEAYDRVMSVLRTGFNGATP